MAKKKKSSGANVPMSAAPSMPERKSVETEEVENGFVVRVSHEGKQGYKSKRYIAFSQPEATRIASQGMSGLSMKGGKNKKAKGKKLAIKKA